MIVIVDEPKRQYYASIVAVPLFRKIANIPIQGNKVKPKLMPDIEGEYADTKGKNDVKDKRLSKKVEELKPSDPNTVPDLRGRSLRQALKLIGDSWADVKTYGHGRVVRQEPLAGKRDKDSKVISIWLE